MKQLIIFHQDNILLDTIKRKLAKALPEVEIRAAGTIPDAQAALEGAHPQVALIGNSFIALISTIRGLNPEAYVYNVTGSNIGTPSGVDKVVISIEFTEERIIAEIASKFE